MLKTKLLRWLKSNPVSGIIPLSPGQAKWTPRNYAQLADEGYNKNVVCYSAVNLIASSCGQVKYQAFINDEPVDNHPIIDLLNNPNPQMGKAEFIFAAVAHRMLQGNSYINAVGSGANQDGTAPTYNWIPTELWVNRPDRYKAIEGSTSLVAGYVYENAGKKKTFPVDQATGQSNLLHWKTFHPTNDYYGLSAIEAAAVGIDIYNQSMEWNKAFFDNGARPSGALMYDGEGNLDEGAYNLLKKEVDAMYSGSPNNGRPLLLDKLQWVQFSLSPKDMDFIQAKDTTAKDIARAFGVPPILLNIGSDTTFNNQAEARLALWEDTIIPTMGSFISEINTWLAPRYGDGVVVKADLSGVSALEIRREKHWERARTADFLTVNEKRALVEMPPVEGGDDVLIQSTLIPLTFEVEEPESSNDKGLSMLLESKSVEFKLLDGSRRAEQREQAIQDRLMASLERPFTVKVNRVLNKYVNKSAAMAAESTSFSVDAALAGMDDDLLKIYEPHYRRTMKTFGKRTLDGLKSFSDHMLETKQEEDIFLASVENWIEDNGAERVAFVADTTKEAIKEALQVGIAENATGPEMAKIIREKTGGTIAKNRSLVISRTETHAAANAASVSAVDSTGLELNKVWIAAADDRTRDTHVKADSDSHASPIPKDAMFSVGSDNMTAPGLGSVPEENVNCRCVVGWESAK